MKKLSNLINFKNKPQVSLTFVRGLLKAGKIEMATNYFDLIEGDADDLILEAVREFLNSSTHSEDESVETAENLYHFFKLIRITK